MSRARNAGESALWPGPAQPSAESVRVERGSCSLEDILETTSLNFTVVLTMCAQEMQIAGAPTDW